MDRTIRLKLTTTPEQAQVLQETLNQFTHAFNAVCEYGWEHKEKNGVRLHHETYYAVKTLYPGLVSDLIIQARVKATEALKSAFTLQRKRAKKKVNLGQKPPPPIRCPRSRLCAARYNVHTYKLDWHSHTVKLSTTGGRLQLGFKVPPYAEKYIGLSTATADLIYRKGRFWLHVVVTLPEPSFVASDEVIGVDLGLNHPAVTSTRQFLGDKHWKEMDRRNFRLKRALQSKGTRSAKRHLRKLSGRSARFRRDCDHVLSKRIVQSATAGATIVIENLRDIRSGARFRKGEGQRRLHSWRLPNCAAS